MGNLTNRKTEMYKPKVGHIGLVRTPFHVFKIRTYLAALIRFFNRTKYNHVFIITEINYRSFVCEADVRIIATPAKYRLKGKDVIIKEPFQSFENISEVAHDYLGHVGYDYRGTMFDQLIYQLFKVWIGRTKEEAEKKMYCSEYVARIFNKVSEGKMYSDWWRTTPRDFIKDETNFKTVYKGIL
jgi:hypothetical protein